MGDAIEDTRNYVLKNLKKILSRTGMGDDLVKNLVDILEHAGKNPLLAITFGFVNYFSYLAINAMIYAACRVYNKVNGNKKIEVTYSKKFLRELGDDKVFSYVAGGIVCPVIEELIFRYFPAVVSYCLLGPPGAIAGLFVASIAFALSHRKNYEKGDKIATFLHFLHGLLFSYVFIIGGLYASTALHQLINTVAITYLRKKIKNKRENYS